MRLISVCVCERERAAGMLSAQLIITVLVLLCAHVFDCQNLLC